MSDTDAYLETITTDGFVAATRQAVVQVYENTASLVEIEKQLAELVGLLAKRLDKLEKKP
jgi:hypothetical protein